MVDRPPAATQPRHPRRRQDLEDIFGEPPTYSAGRRPGGRRPVSVAAGRPGGRAPNLGLANQIISGRNGWLFLGDEFTAACHPQLTLSQVISGLRRLDQIITASGRKLVIMIPPDKDTVDGRFLPVRGAPTVRVRCAEKALLWRALGSLKLPALVDMLPLLQGRGDVPPHQPAYLPIDSHWNDRIGSQGVPAGDPQFAESSALPQRSRGRRSESRATWATSACSPGSPKTATDTMYSVTRPGVAPGKSTVTNPFAELPDLALPQLFRPGRAPLVAGRSAHLRRLVHRALARDHRPVLRRLHADPGALPRRRRRTRGARRRALAPDQADTRQLTS